MTAVFAANYGVKPEIKVITKLTNNHEERSTVLNLTDFSRKQIFDAMNQPHIIRTQLFKQSNNRQ